MGLRTALETSKILTFTVAAIFVWVLLATFRVATAFDWYAVSTSGFLGRNALGGIAGLVVMLVLLGVMLALFAELTETEPAPDAWPPSE